MAGKGKGVLNLDIGGDIGGRSVLWVAEGGNRGLRVGVRGAQSVECVCVLRGRGAGGSGIQGRKKV